jgi:hypothetical protein
VAMTTCPSPGRTAATGKGVHFALSDITGPETRSYTSRV